MVKKVQAGHSIAPLLIVMLVAVVAVSGMFVMGGSGVSWVGGGVTGAQVAEAEGCNYDRYSSMSQWAEDKMSEGWALNYGWSCPSADEIPEVPGQVFECTETSFGACGWIRAARYVECESDQEEISTTGNALALSGKEEPTGSYSVLRCLRLFCLVY